MTRTRCRGVLVALLAGGLEPVERVAGQYAVAFDKDSDRLADEPVAFEGLFEVVEFGGGFAE